MGRKKPRRTLNYLRFEILVGEVEEHPEHEKNPLARTIHSYQHKVFESMWTRKNGKPKTKKQKTWLWLWLTSTIGHWVHLAVDEIIKSWSRSTVWK